MGGAASWLAVLSAIRKKTEQAMRNKPVNSFIASVSVPDSRYLPQEPAMTSISDGLTSWNVK